MWPRTIAPRDREQHRAVRTLVSPVVRRVTGRSWRSRSHSDWSHHDPAGCCSSRRHAVDRRSIQPRSSAGQRRILDRPAGSRRTDSTHSHSSRRYCPAWHHSRTSCSIAGHARNRADGCRLPAERSSSRWSNRDRLRSCGHRSASNPGRSGRHVAHTVGRRCPGLATARRAHDSCLVPERRPWFRWKSPALQRSTRYRWLLRTS